MTEAVAHDNPRRSDEGSLHYIERIAILAGLMSPGRAAFSDNSQLGPRAHDVALGRTQRPVVDLSAVRLPYAREPGDDDGPVSSGPRSP